MAALTSGKKAPEIKIPLLKGGTFSLHEALARGPVVVAFFKINCPTCQYSFPFIERLYQAHKHSNVTIVGISRNDDKNTEAFNQRFGVTFPVALDAKGFPASNAYGLTNVPSIFLIAQDGTIEVSCVGWSRADLEEIHTRLRGGHDNVPPELWQKTESVLEFKAG